MIKSLHIKNYALIQQLHMDPSPNLNTITGETGAGKSIMLGALGLLLGNRADTKVLYESGEKCIIEGLFNISKLNIGEIFDGFELDYQEETIIRREISPTGKSRAFINDTPVTLDIMKAIGNYLVDIHSQRDTYLLGDASYQLRMIDGFAQNARILSEYKKVYKSYKKEQFAYDSLNEQSEVLKKESDYNHFLLDELDKAVLSEGEQEKLEKELQIIEHAEVIKSKLFESREILENSEYSINTGLQQVLKNIEQISRFAEHFESLKNQLESCYLELNDISREIENEIHNIDFDKERQEEIQERLGLLFQLTQKHHVNTEGELIETREELRLKVSKVLNLDKELSNKKTVLDKLEKELKSIGHKLSASRLKVLRPFKKELENDLVELAMPHAAIDINHVIVQATENGFDKINILFSANAGVATQDLKNVASGGEFSRLMFCIKYMLADKTSLPTIIFDEIDSGISGEVAMKMVYMMKEMASSHQVVAITHLPQIAASGDVHYFVYKENENSRSVSKIKKLEQSQRQEEIAKMIGGDSPSDAALENARELLGR